MERQSLTVNIMCPKRIWMVLAVGVSFSWVPQSGYPAGSLIGTTNISYQIASYPFDPATFAEGFVSLNQGFSVLPGETVTLINLLAPLAGSINLNDTGKITLDGDVHCDSSFSLASGGIIDGAGNTVFLGGDLAIPAGKTLSIASNTVIDGQNHNVIFNAGSVLQIDGAVGTTLTLKNMTINGVQGYAFIFGLALNQKLVLDNVTMNLVGDTAFTGGMLSVRNRTVITGAYVFYYQASYDCTILTQSTLFLDVNTIFAYIPGDESNLHVVFADASARLFLNGATVYAPANVGLQLTKGQVFVDYASTLESNGGNKSTKGFSFGNGTAAEDISVFIAPDASLVNVTGLFTYANQN